MKVPDVLSLASRQGVELWAEKGRLRYRAKRGSLTAELRQLILENREAILAHLEKGLHCEHKDHELSYNQQFLWFQYQLSPASAAYNVAFVARIVSSVDLSRIRAAFQKIIDRHPMLRATFHDINGIPSMRIHESAELAWEVIDASGWDEEVLHREAHRRYSRPFDLARGPIFRLDIFKTGQQGCIMLLTVHHIACDGRSISIIMNEFRELYSMDAGAELPSVVGSYADFTNRQGEMVKGPEGERLFSFWKKNLAGDISELQLPTARGLSSIDLHRGATYHFSIEGDLYRRIVTKAKDFRATLYTFLLASFQVLLMRYSSQEDILIGTPMADRLGADDESTVGCFVNPVVMRGRVSGNFSFEELLRHTRKTFGAALEHRHYPFSALVEQLNPARGPSGSPFFRVMFNLLTRRSLGEISDLLCRNRAGEFSAEEVDFGELKMRPFALDQEEGQFDLMLEMIDNERSLTALIKYNPELFFEATIVRMAGHFEMLLKGAVKDPLCRLSDLPLLTGTERNQILYEWNRTEADYPQDVVLHGIFEKQAARTPDAVAVVFEGESLTYRELDVCANRLAHHLRTLGVGPEVLVGVHLERSLELVIALYGILKAGGVYVPLDPEYPPERLAFIIDEIKAPVILSQERLRNKLPPDVPGVLQFNYKDSAWALSESPPDTAPDSNVGPDSAAYVIYTSGSTGKPKGVIITHRAICNRLLWMQDAFRLTAEDAVLQKTPFSFDVAVWEFFWPLLCGARLVVARPGGHRDSDYLAETIARNRVTNVHFVPSMLQIFLEKREPGFCAGLKRVICSGEALSYELQERFYSLMGAELHNLYGPTEAAIDVTWWACRKGDERRVVPIGRPIANTHIYILDAQMQPVPIGVSGELFIGGVQVAREYLDRPDLTAESFVPDPFSNGQGARLYRTGDLCRYLPDGNIEYLGRKDFQVKIRGFRIELGEIESNLRQFPEVREAVVMPHDEPSGGIRLVGYTLPNSSVEISIDQLRSFLRARLPDYMIPATFMQMKAFPLTPSGKIDRKALPKPETVRQTEKTFAAPRGETERRIAEIWKEILGVDSVGLDDNFFDLGGHSLLLIRMVSRLREVFHKDIEIIELFQHPTVGEQGRLLVKEADGGGFSGSGRIQPTLDQRENAQTAVHEGIAVVGMACRFPGADNIDRFWQNLRQGIESIRRFTEEDLAELGIPPEVSSDPNFVKAAPVLDDIDKFDAAFFGYSPKEAEIIDPQHRLFLECAWAALEDAGCDAESYGGSIGVFGGVGPNYYAGGSWSSLKGNDVAGIYQREIGNEKDYLTTRVSYKLNLKGPSFTIQTACSTSLVAAHVACQHLLTNQCDMALAGGVSINVLLKGGYFYQDGMIPSPDGHCRAFDERAQGTVVGQGVGAVVLKRLADAIADGNGIYAVIRGSAINNDGSARVGFTAPGVEGQTEVIVKAQSLAGVSPEDIGYVETHGTGTPLGDPIEIKALTEAFRRTAEKNGFCAIGSVKTNIGHLDAAAGVAGLIKTALILKNGEIPPSLHFEKPNPKIDFDSSPFFVNTQLRKWDSTDRPRRAGVSSFGLGGTNCHMVLEEAPRPMASDVSRPMSLLPFSAKTPNTLEAMATNMVAHLRMNPNANLEDIAYTLQVGRKAMEHRQAIVCAGIDSAIVALSSPDFIQKSVSVKDRTRPDITFMFSGQGSQYANMGLELYQEEPVFREQIDRCSELLRQELAVDLRTLFYPERTRIEEAEEKLRQTHIAQPALFTIEFALAELWMKWGIYPQSLVGHSIGEYTAACLAGVFSLESALKLVAARGRLMQGMPPGSMLAVSLTERDLEPYLNEGVSIAAHNSPSLCVVSGENRAIERLESLLADRQISHRPIQTSHAFHSKMMEPVLAPFAEIIGQIDLRPPKIPFLSNVTGRWITDEQATDPGYWTAQLRNPVRFSDCVSELLKEHDRIFLEVGPGRGLSMLVSQRPDKKSSHVILSTTRHPKEKRSDIGYILETLSALWRSGVIVNWHNFQEGRKRRRLSLPTYPFERKRYWIEPGSVDGESTQRAGILLGNGKVKEREKALLWAEKHPIGGGGRTADPSLFRSEEERLLADIWKDLLNLESIGPADNYFELGGSSLFAVRLFDQIERVFKKRLPLATLYETPTLRELADRLAMPANERGWSSLVEVKRGKMEIPPLFLVHSEGGNVLEYWPLSKYFSTDQPIYALQAKGLEGEAVIDQSVEEMAEHFLAEIKSVQGKGPYYLGGYCLGGLVAYEMARQLLNTGEKISMLALISTRTPGYIEKSRVNAGLLRKLIERLIERAAMEMRNLSYLDWRQKVNYSRERLMLLLNLIRVNSERAIEIMTKSLGIKANWHSRDYYLRMTVMNQRKAHYRYKPTSCDLDVILFRAKSDPSYYLKDESLGWSKYIKGNITIFEVDAFHKNIMKEPNIRQVGERLSKLVRLAQAGSAEQ